VIAALPMQHEVQAVWLDSDDDLLEDCSQDQSDRAKYRRVPVRC
jgi:hypothetical protein